MPETGSKPPHDAAHFYRYRTPALVGPWRKSERMALRDALRARQALRDERDRRAVRWLVPGEIETKVTRPSAHADA
jgi:hypothetical protein